MKKDYFKEQPVVEAMMKLLVYMDEVYNCLPSKDEFLQKLIVDLLEAVINEAEKGNQNDMVENFLNDIDIKGREN